ncbi:MAG: hypothetical protein NVSMB52_12840 [Chloroflexota bacterium]
MKQWSILVVAALALLPGTVPVHAMAQRGSHPSKFDSVISRIESLPYQPAYAPIGTDSAFPDSPTLNTFPAEDYTSGSIPGSPDAPAWPSSFKQVVLHSADGAPFFGEIAMHPGIHPGIVVVHGFNTHGMLSVIRWAAMLAANGYNVLAADQRDFSYEFSAGYGYPKFVQSFGWKESQDVLAAGKYLRAQRGVGAMGIVGFSEGAQNTVLTLAQDTRRIFSAGLTFSAPADQDTQVYSTAVPQNCQTPSCTYPATDALLALVVPPYTYSDPCAVLSDAAKAYKVTPYSILTHESAMHAQSRVHVPLLNFYAADDSLVAPFNAQFMAAFESGNPMQRTIEIQHGEHAYYFDRWWQQKAILAYFHDLLPGGRVVSTNATVNQTPGGPPLSSQTVPINAPSRAQADNSLAPYICDTKQSAPGRHYLP